MFLTRQKWCVLFPFYALIIGISALAVLAYEATRYGIGIAPCLILFAAVSVCSVGANAEQIRIWRELC